MGKGIFTMGRCLSSPVVAAMDTSADHHGVCHPDAVFWTLTKLSSPFLQRIPSAEGSHLAPWNLKVSPAPHPTHGSTHSTTGYHEDIKGQPHGTSRRSSVTFFILWSYPLPSLAAHQGSGQGWSLAETTRLLASCSLPLLLHSPSYRFFPHHTSINPIP